MMVLWHSVHLESISGALVTKNEKIKAYLFFNEFVIYLSANRLGWLRRIETEFEILISVSAQCECTLIEP